jgi:hypothetical protein
VAGRQQQGDARRCRDRGSIENRDDRKGLHRKGDAGRCRDRGSRNDSRGSNRGKQKALARRCTK